MNPGLTRFLEKIAVTLRKRGRPALLLIFGLPAFNGSGQSQLSVGNGAGVPGSSVSVPTALSSSTNLVAVQYDVIFTSTNLTASVAEPGTEQPNHLVASSLIKPGLRRVVLYSHSNALLTNGVLANLVFSIATNAPPGVTSLTLTNPIFADAQANPVAPIGLASGFVLTLTAPARFGSILLSTNGVVQFQIFGSENQSYVIQSSTNLSQWVDMSTNMVIGGQISFSDQTASLSTYRFYRAKSSQ